MLSLQRAYVWHTLVCHVSWLQCVCVCLCWGGSRHSTQEAACLLPNGTIFPSRLASSPETSSSCPRSFLVMACHSATSPSTCGLTGDAGDWAWGPLRAQCEVFYCAGSLSQRLPALRWSNGPIALLCLPALSWEWGPENQLFILNVRLRFIKCRNSLLTP